MTIESRLHPSVWQETGFRKASTATPPAASVATAWWQRLRVWWQRLRRLGQRAPRRLRLCDSLPLGERRFVAVVEFERSRFLVGGTAASLVLLARLGNGRAQDGEDRKNENEGNEKKNDTKNEEDIARPASAFSGRLQP
jgi:flagellar biogenesis protein FliO